MAETASHTDIQTTNEAGFTDLPVGEILRRTRLHYDLSIEEVESALRIRASQIEAIETGDLSKLPGKVYAIGFVRSYAEYMGLDGDKMVALFKKQAIGKTQEPELHFPIPASDGNLPPLWLMLVCIVVVIAGIGIWFGESRENRELVENIPAVPKEMQMAAEEIQAPSEPESAPPETEEEVIAEKPVEGIILNIVENSWVEIRDEKGKALISRVLKAGDQYYVPDRPDLTISIGNAGGVDIEVDGQKLKKLGKDKQVVRRVSLDAEYLKENFALETAP